MDDNVQLFNVKMRLRPNYVIIFVQRYHGKSIDITKGRELKKIILRHVL